MLGSSWLGLLVFGTSVLANPLQPRQDEQVISAEFVSKAIQACNAISKAGVAVYYPASPQYITGVSHYAKNAAQNSTCVVEPDTPQKVGKILKIVGRLQVPFAVQSGGHAINPGFSSTTGVHISMNRFKHVKLARDRLTADVGTGLRWGEVYAALEGSGRTAVGGRVSVVGVGGFLMYGGGYSFHTSEYGLGVDQVVEYTLVLPCGDVQKVSARSDRELFNALKGTGNNFGIVTSFKLKTVPSTQVWGGSIIYTGDNFAQISAVVANFSANNIDPKASLLAPFSAVIPQQAPLIPVQMFYNGPTPPPGVFDAILALEPYMVYPGFGTRNFTDHIASVPTEAFAARNLYQYLPVRAYTPRILKAITDLTIDYAIKGRGLAESGIGLSIAVEPFSKQAFTFSSGQEAFLHDEKHGCLPTNIAVTWASSEHDAYWKTTLEGIHANLTAIVAEEGQDTKDCPFYPNYSLYDNPLEKIYLGNLPKLRKLQNKIDPKNVMALAGGFKL